MFSPPITVGAIKRIENISAKSKRRPKKINKKSNF
jgi:hypothetical protein